ncbi:MAG: hypothetical protein ACRD3T_11350 [Terriglobia bacterium]
MKPGYWHEGVTGWREILFWLVVLVGINVYAWWTHGDWSVAFAISAFLALFLEFDLSTRQIRRLMDRVKELEDQTYIVKDLQNRMYTLEAQAK